LGSSEMSAVNRNNARTLSRYRRKSIARSAHNAPHTFTSDSRHARAAVMYVRSTDTFTSNASRSLPTEAGVAGAAGVLAVLDADVAGISALLRVLSIELIASSSSCTTHATAGSDVRDVRAGGADARRIASLDEARGEVSVAPTSTTTTERRSLSSLSAASHNTPMC
jgi:hypothetical protein